MKIITAFLLALATIATTATAHADPCEPITNVKCTQIAIDGENCHDGSANDSRGAFYGPLTLADGTVTCDAWHGFGDQYTYAAGTSSLGTAVDDHPDATNAQMASFICVLGAPHASGGTSYTCGVLIDLPLAGRVQLTCTVIVAADGTASAQCITGDGSN